MTNFRIELEINRHTNKTINEVRNFIVKLLNPFFDVKKIEVRETIKKEA